MNWLLLSFTQNPDSPSKPTKAPVPALRESEALTHRPGEYLAGLVPEEKSHD
ncbi:hypothetical protein [Pseudomonas saudiphocaensis]|jgi:hypothetical protein|uniref:hypothetical protein n=1 Tax=Pseudomonas saudiphocaensis TaxID=1499686 RepID=UPI00187D4E72|nr:hypothetical protein [Pseudomonas saudiphocaensis]MBE7927385.1 hypothetical protein [Pseudomonas saudiphocaensis]